MAASVAILVARLASVGGLPEDIVENVFHLGYTASSGDLQDAAEAVEAFYNDVATGATTSIAEKLSTSLSRTADACAVNVYVQADLTGVTPTGSPTVIHPFTLGAADNTEPLPEEVATVISYHGDLSVPVQQVNPSPPPAFIRPQSRRRGRLYIGPLAQSTGSDTGARFRPLATWMEDLGLALLDLHTAFGALAGDGYFGVWSKADAEVYELEGGWVDDAWDTQRRRGVAATTRTSFAV